MTREGKTQLRIGMVFTGLCLLIAMAQPATARVLVDENFEDVSANVGSQLTGLSSWTTWLDRSSIVANGSGVNTSTVIDTMAGTTAPNNTGNRRTYSNFNITTDETVIMEFDAWSGAAVDSGTVSIFSIGNNGGGLSGPMFGFQAGSFIVRGESFGTITTAKTTSNTNFQPVADTWYRVRSEWDIAAKTGTLFVRDLSGNDANVTDTGFQQLFFNDARTDATASLGSLSNLANWNEAWVRLGGSTGGGQGYGAADNLLAKADHVLARYGFGATTPIDLTSSGHVAASNPGAFDAGSGVGANLTNGSANGNPLRSVFLTGPSLNQTSESGAIAANDYLTFDVTPATGMNLSFSQLTFDYQRDGLDAPSNWSLRADEDSGDGDNFATQIAAGVFTDTVGLSGTTGENFFRYTVDLSQIAFLQDLTTTTSFRLYLWGAASDNPEDTNKARIDNVVVYGQSAVIPEPISLVLLIGGMPLLMRRRKHSAISSNPRK